jgi:hypothetical protein
MPDVWPSTGVARVVGFEPSRQYFSKRDNEWKDSLESAQLLIDCEDGSKRLVDFLVRDFDKLNPPVDVKAVTAAQRVRFVAEVVVPSRDAAPTNRAYVRLLGAQVVSANGEVLPNGAGHIDLEPAAA